MKGVYGDVMRVVLTRLTRELINTTPNTHTHTQCQTTQHRRRSHKKAINVQKQAKALHKVRWTRMMIYCYVDDADDIVLWICPCTPLPFLCVNSQYATCMYIHHTQSPFIHHHHQYTTTITTHRWCRAWSRAGTRSSCKAIRTSSTRRTSTGCQSYRPMASCCSCCETQGVGPHPTTTPTTQRWCRPPHRHHHHYHKWEPLGRGHGQVPSTWCGCGWGW